LFPEGDVNVIKACFTPEISSVTFAFIFTVSPPTFVDKLPKKLI